LARLKYLDQFSAKSLWPFQNTCGIIPTEMTHIRLPPAPPAKSSSVQASMRGNRSSKTRPENWLEQELFNAGIRDFCHNSQALPGSPDLVFAEAKVAVFVHGCFWHRCPYCHPHFPDSNQEYWSAKFARNKARDKRVRSLLRSQGWKPISIWECQLKKNPRRATARVLKALEGVIG